MAYPHQRDPIRVHEETMYTYRVKLLTPHNQTVTDLLFEFASVTELMANIERWNSFDPTIWFYWPDGPACAYYHPRDPRTYAQGNRSVEATMAHAALLELGRPERCPEALRGDFADRLKKDQEQFDGLAAQADTIIRLRKMNTNQIDTIINQRAKIKSLETTLAAQADTIISQRARIKSLETMFDTLAGIANAALDRLP